MAKSIPKKGLFCYLNNMIFHLLAKVVYSADADGNAIDPGPIQELPLPDLPQGDYGVAFVKMFLTLIVLVLLLVGTLWFLRRLCRSRLQKNGGEQGIQILEKRMLSTKSILYLVEVEGKKVLLAESQHEIRRLQTWDSEENSTDD